MNKRKGLFPIKNEFPFYIEENKSENYVEFKYNGKDFSGECLYRWFPDGGTLFFNIPEKYCIDGELRFYTVSKIRNKDMEKVKQEIKEDWNNRKHNYLK